MFGPAVSVISILTELLPAFRLAVKFVDDQLVQELVGLKAKLEFTVVPFTITAKGLLLEPPLA